MTDLRFQTANSVDKFEDNPIDHMNPIYLLVTFLLTAPLTAQVYVYQNLVPGTAESLLSTALETSTAYYHVGSSHANDYYGDILLIKTNKQGVTLWARTYGIQGPRELGTSITEADNGNIIVGGIKYDNVGQNDDIVLLEIDTNGFMQWNHTYGGNALEDGGLVLKTTDGGYLISGSSWSFGFTAMKVFFIKTDASGNVLWDRAYGDTISNNVYDMVATPDGGFAVLGMRAGLALPQFVLMQIDSTGNMTWTKQINAPSPVDIGGLHAVSTGGYLITGRCDTISGLVIRVDGNGNLMWNHTYTFGSSIFISEANERNSAFVFSGTTHDQIDADVFIMETDTMGMPLWINEYGSSSNSEQPGGIMVTSDNGFLMSGNSWGFLPGAHGYVVKTDNNGASGCNEFTASYATGTAVITISPVTLTDTSGIGDSTLTFGVAVNSGFQNLCGVGIEESTDQTQMLYPNLLANGENPKCIAKNVTEAIVYGIDGALISTQMILTSESVVIPSTPGIYLVSLYSENTLLGTQKVIRAD